MKGQIAFDFIISLGALSLLVITLFSIVSFHNLQSVRFNERILMERTCEILSSKLVIAKVNGNGWNDTFYTRIPITFNGSRTVVFGEDYVCITPEEFTLNVNGTYDGEFAVKNLNEKLVIERLS